MKWATVHSSPLLHSNIWKHVNDILIKRLHALTHACAHTSGSGESGSNYLYFSWTLAFPLTLSLMYVSCGLCNPAVNPQKMGRGCPDQLSLVPTKMKSNWTFRSNATLCYSPLISWNYCCLRDPGALGSKFPWGHAGNAFCFTTAFSFKAQLPRECIKIQS